MKNFNESVKFFVWAIGIGVSLIVGAYAMFPSRELVEQKFQARDQKIQALEESARRIEKKTDDFQNWLRDNWGRRSPRR